MKRVILGFLAAVCFAGIASAEPKRGDESLSNYYTYKSTNIGLTNGFQSTYGAYLHKVIVSSPSAVTTTGGSTVTFYNASGSATNKLFAVSASTNDLTGFNEFELNVYASSGIYIVNATTGTFGSMQLVYYPNGVPNNAAVWASSFTVASGSTQTISVGTVLLHSVSVLTKGPASTVMKVYDSSSTAPTNQVAQVDLSSVKEYNFDVMLSSGLTITATAGSAGPAQVLIRYRRSPRLDYEYWKPYYATGTLARTNIATGTYVLGGIVNGTANATGNLIVYDSTSAATGKIADVDAVSTFGKKMYDVNINKGLAVENVGTGTFTILYRKK